MSHELVKVTPVDVAALNNAVSLLVLMERARGRHASPGRNSSMPTPPAYATGLSASGQGVPGLGRGAGVELASITPGMVGNYLVGLGGSPARRNQYLAALRGFFDRMVNRHACMFNPAASVRGVKDQVVEGKTPEITIDHARKLLASIKLSCKVKTKQGEPVEVPLPVGLRDWAILATLAYTACRAGAVAKLRLGDFQDDGAQYVLRFQEKGGKSREIPVRHDLEGIILAYVEAAGIAGEARESPLFRASNGRSRKLAAGPLGTERICELVKRRLKDAGLPSRLSPHSFRVTAITSLLEQGVPMEDVQYLAGHAEPRTTTLYDRRKKKVTRNIVERIPI
jgi:integrase/recombinase XerD